LKTGQNLVKIDIVFKAGAYYQQKPLIAGITNAMLKEGTTSYSSEKISETLDHYGANMHTESDKDRAVAGLTTLKKFCSDLFPLISDMIHNPVFPEKEVNHLVNQEKQHFLIQEKEVKHIARKKFFNALYGGAHPYGETIELKHFEQISRNELVYFFKEFYIPSKCHIIATGDLPDDFLELAQRYFGQVQKQNKNKPINSEETPSLEKKHYIHKRDAVQCGIRIGKKLFTRHHPDYIEMQVLASVLGGYFGSRLMKNIREEKGYTYGIASIINSLEKSGYFVIASETGAHVTQQAIDEIYKEINDLLNNPIPEEELLVVKNYLIGSVMRMTDGIHGISEALNLIVKFGLPYHYFQDVVDRVRTTTPNRLQELANKYFQLDTLYEVVAGHYE
jgi:predicted Zn-dependent peptidase